MKNGTIIVGAGHAGSQLATTLRQEGYDEPITLLGREVEFPYHRPPLSKAFLKGMNDRTQPLRGDDTYRANRIDFMPSVVVETLDLGARAVVLDTGERRRFDKLVLATGATPRHLAVPGGDLPGVVAIRTIADSRRLRALLPDAMNVVVVGGGFIGLEVAATMAALGKAVTVVEIGGRLLGRVVSPLISDHVLTRLSHGGIRVLLGTGVARIMAQGGGVHAVRTGTGEDIDADIVVVGIGVDPDTHLAREAKIDCDDGILVDPSLTTSHPDVLAIGDCARFHHWHAGRSVRLESVQNATDQARVAARTIIGKEAEFRAVPWFWSDIGDMKLQMAGLSFDADRHVVTGQSTGNAFSVYHFAGERLLAVDSVNRPADHMLARRMLATGFSPKAGDLRDGIVAAVFKQHQANAAVDLTVAAQE